MSLLAAMSVLASSPQDERGEVLLTEGAQRVHREGFVFDGHNDLPWKMRERAGSSFERVDISESVPEFHTDIPRLFAGGVGAQFWSVYVPATSTRPLHEVLEQIDLVRRMVERYPETFEMAFDAADVERIRGAGKIASLIGIEGGHAIEDSLAVLRMLHHAGARYMTLTHSDTLDWADSATDDAKSGGLSPFGEEVVRTMNELGMLVDISHVSVETMLDALRVTRAPLIASHSSAFALAEHPRNVPDDVLEKVAENGGVVMINFFSGFVVAESAKRLQDMFDVQRELEKEHPDFSEYRDAMAEWRRANPIEAGSVHDVVDHIQHVARVAGIDHVGLGSDFDGIPIVPRQLADVSCYPYITQELLNRGFSEADVHKVLGGNVLRVLRVAGEVARGAGAANR